MLRVVAEVFITINISLRYRDGVLLEVYIVDGWLFIFSHLQLFSLLKSTIINFEFQNPEWWFLLPCSFWHFHAFLLLMMLMKKGLGKIIIFIIMIKSGNISSKRNAKLFFISTSSTTSTVSTTTLCYATNTAAACTSGRKRRAINFMDKQENDEEAMDLNPAPVDEKDRYGVGISYDNTSPSWCQG